MRRTFAFALLLFLVNTGSPRAEVRLSDFIHVLGSVSNSSRPIEHAAVIAFNLSTYYVAQTFTGTDGTFRLPALPSGMYRVIAVKTGFAPAVLTIGPDRKDHRVALNLRAAAPEDARNAIWEIRRSMPSDVLREIDIADFAPPPPLQPVGEARVSGEMSSLRNVQPGRELTSSYEATAVGVRGKFGDGWTVDFAGRLQHIDSVESPSHEGLPLAASSGVSMEIRPSSVGSYRIASRKNSWMLDQGDEVDLQAHQFAWERPNSSVQVNYVSHENLFPDGSYDAEVIEVSGERRLQNSARSNFDVFLKVGQENLTGLPAAEVYRTAMMSATGRYAIVPAVRLRYGVHTYVTDNRSEWAPETGAEFQLGPRTAMVLAALYKVAQAESPEARLPSVVFLNQSGAISPRYRYSVGIVSGDDKTGLFSAAANVAEIDSLVRVVFDDRFDQFWDAFFLQDGDLYRDVTVAVRKQFGSILVLDVTTTAGRAENAQLPDADSRSYVTGTVQSHFRPSGTSLEVSYRQIEQPHLSGDLFDSERLNLRMGQSLRLPLDMRLLVGVDLARAPESPVLVDLHAPDSVQRRLVGGISFAF